MIMIDWLGIFAASLGFVSLVSVILIARTLEERIKKMDIKARSFEQQVKAVTTGAVGMGHRILALEEKLNSFSTEENLAVDNDSFAYTQAKQMFDQGADTETVASNCGFSSSEAQLMALIQKRLKQGAPVL